jgi:hypothetical protein
LLRRMRELEKQVAQLTARSGGQAAGV